ncbi:MAG: tyrosine-type recombinase/integrase [Sedimentibacter sp.]|uniref:tyrosine-type recombinase/integrase n=1 Tax=Sedimentibacter sp. TaxID=1960295 RepID=UPI002981821D|nr:tyrosine-type recombinase/integrase [Sedimentibacter sp.]MDW5300681.1 tyrosine-type recombinase/integrase [Sedimentibacter sp.]
MLVQDFLNNWVSTYGKYNLKVTTSNEYIRHINQYVNPRIGLIEIENLKPLQLQNLYYELLDSGRQRGDLTKPLNAKTVLQTHRILHKAFKNAVQLELINSNPADAVDLPKKKKYNYNILLGQDLKDFIESFKGTHIYNGVMLALLLGLRRGELLALQYKDINLTEHDVIINKSVVNGKGFIKLDTTKNDSSNRIIALSDDMMKFLKVIKDNALNNSEESFIIQNIRGEMYNPASFSRLYTWTRDNRNLPKVRFHDLRHIHATILYQNGIKAKVIQERLGHSNISTTLDIYTHLFKEDQVAAAEIISDKIFY